MSYTQENAGTERLPERFLLKWFETLAVTALFVFIGALNRPDDPFYLTGSFSWPALAPLLVALRYGFFMGLVSALLLLGTVGIAFRMALVPGGEFPYVWSTGILAVSLLAGEFRDYWERQADKLKASNRYRQVRLEEFTRNFYLLKVSHDRLEQQIAGSSSSLREALRRLYHEIAHANGRGLNSETGDLMLQLLVRYGQLQIAAIYGVNNDTLAEQPVARIGNFNDVHKQDPLLQHALQERKLVSLQSEYRQKLEELDTNLLLAIPLITSQQTVIGMVVVEAMPFFNFQPKTLRLLAILTGHMADIVHQQAHISPEADTEWQQFRFQMDRADCDARDHKLPAAVVHFSFASDPDAETVTARIRQLRRGLDVIAELPDKNGHQLAILLPLTDELGQTAYLQRLEDDIRTHTGKTLSELAQVQSLMITGKTSASEWLSGFLKGDASS